MTSLESFFVSLSLAYRYWYAVILWEISLLVLIDESGCPGFKLTEGSTRYFIVVMVIFADFLVAEKTSRSIEELRKKLNVYPEFKFSKSHPEIKDSFFDAIIHDDFEIYALIVDKKNSHHAQLKGGKNACYHDFLKMLLHYDHNLLSNASIKIDGSGNKAFKKELTHNLRQQIGKEKIKKIKLVDSKKDNLIQLADMIAGAISRHYHQKRPNSSRWFNVLNSKGRIRKIWNFH